MPVINEADPNDDRSERKHRLRCPDTGLVILMTDDQEDELLYLAARKASIECTIEIAED